MTIEEKSIISEYIYNLKHEGINRPKRLFDTPNIKDIYTHIKELNIKNNADFETPESYNVVLAWLALFSGDNSTLYTLARSTDETKLDDKFLAFFEELKALSGLFGKPEERLVHSEKAFEILGEKNRTFFMANARLTHGQILVGNNRLREAAENFSEAYDMFIEHQLFFPASVSLTNALLNWFRLGEFKKVKSKAKHALLVSSIYGKEGKLYWDVLRLPLGMCYLEENRLRLAIDNLEKAKKAIDKLNLIHMHGFIEIYRLKAYALQNDKDSLRKIITEAEAQFKNMHYPMMSWIILYGKMLLEEKFTGREIELLETSYEESAYKPMILIEMLTLLHNSSQSSFLKEKHLTDIIAKYRQSENMINLQSALLQLGEYYYMKNDQKAAERTLKEAVVLYRKTELKAAFYLFPFHFWSLIQKIDPEIRLPEKLQIHVESLTPREKEVLKLISEGKSNSEISTELFISLGTVKWHIMNIFGKLSVKNRTKAVEEARRFNFL